jgi:hypothetical protein
MKKPDVSPLQSFLQEQAARMQTEPDQRLVMVTAMVAQHFVGLHESIRIAAQQGATANVLQSLAAGEQVDLHAIVSDLSPLRYAYEFLTACSAMVANEVAATDGALAFPELLAIVNAFKARHWSDVAADGAANVN